MYWLSFANFVFFEQRLDRSCILAFSPTKVHVGLEFSLLPDPGARYEASALAIGIVFATNSITIQSVLTV